MTLDLDEIERVTNAATPGPWRDVTECAEEYVSWQGLVCERPNRIFIGKSREWVPALVARVRELEGMLRKHGRHGDGCASVKVIGRFGSRSGLQWSTGDERTCSCGLSASSPAPAEPSESADPAPGNGERRDL